MPPPPPPPPLRKGVKLVKVDLDFGLKMVKAGAPGARLKMVKVPRHPDPYFPPGVCTASRGSRESYSIILIIRYKAAVYHT